MAIDLSTVYNPSDVRTITPGVAAGGGGSDAMDAMIAFQLQRLAQEDAANAALREARRQAELRQLSQVGRPVMAAAAPSSGGSVMGARRGPSSADLHDRAMTRLAKRRAENALQAETEAREAAAQEAGYQQQLRAADLRGPNKTYRSIFGLGTMLVDDPSSLPLSMRPTVQVGQAMPMTETFRRRGFEDAEAAMVEEDRREAKNAQPDRGAAFRSAMLSAAATRPEMAQQPRPTFRPRSETQMRQRGKKSRERMPGTNLPASGFRAGERPD